MRIGKSAIFLLIVLVIPICLPGQEKAFYERPPDAIVDILDHPPTPLVSVDPDEQRLVLIHRTSMPEIADLSQPILRLAGRRFNPRTNGPVASRTGRIYGFTFIEVGSGQKIEVELPAEADLSFPLWSPDGRKIAFTRTTDAGIELWSADTSTGKATKVTEPVLNAVLGSPCDWTPDSTSLLCRTVVPDRGAPPVGDSVPTGPVIRETSGVKAQARTYQDLLSNPHDVALFEHYMTSQLVLVDQEGLNPVGDPGIYQEVSISPDGRFLLVEKIVRPYSYLVPSYYFPYEIEIWDDAGNIISLYSQPLAEDVPILGVRTGPRAHHWRPDVDATLIWVEALDEGNPKIEADFRDRVVTLAAPFTGQPEELAKTRSRYVRSAWTPDGRALISDYDRIKRWTQTWLVDASNRDDKKLIWDRSAQDSYNDPGAPVVHESDRGFGVLLLDGDSIFLTGEGASPEGDRPFLDRFNLSNGETTRLFHSSGEAFESVTEVFNKEGTRLLTRHETVFEPPNFFFRDLQDGTREQLTDFTDPAPQLQGLTKRLITYQREDGIQLSATLYLPPGYQEGQRLPVVMWAYPREFNDPDMASQVRGSPYRFTTLRGPSHLFFLTQGYAIVDDPAMPVVGEQGNDTFVKQLVMNARAAVEKVVEMGLADRERVGIGGHSYGAFMTANLLAHSDLFAAGIARSGAYNRTLTPFGFQNERRTFWEAPEVYFAMSPFMHAHKIQEPVLLIHGEIDNNSGTFPIQSQRLYHALKGLGGTVRYVVLPRESHGYLARESVLHTLAEMINWFDRWVKREGTDSASGAVTESDR